MTFGCSLSKELVTRIDKQCGELIPRSRLIEDILQKHIEKSASTEPKKGGQ